MNQFEILLSWGMTELEARRELAAQAERAEELENGYLSELYDCIELGYLSAHVVAWYHWQKFGTDFTKKAKFF